LKSPKGIVTSIYAYFGWLGDKGIQLVSVGQGTITTVGHIIRDNQSISSTNIKDGRK
jgi:hypothetical protein